MTKVTLVALAAVLLLWDPAYATGKHGHRGHGNGRHGHGGHRLHSSLPNRVFPHHHHHHKFHGHRFHGQGTGFGVFVAPPVYAVPEYVPPVPTYYPPAYRPPVSYAPAPTYAPPPTQTVVEFPNGRYVLHGDGVTAPYRWVWIPNPPPPPADEPAAPPAPPPGPTSMPEPTRNLDFYRWMDEQGVTHFSDRLERVPEAYRSQATKSRT